MTTSCFVGLANSIRTLSIDVTDTEILKKMLQVVPDHLSQIAIPSKPSSTWRPSPWRRWWADLRQVEERYKKKTPPASPLEPIRDK